MQALVMVVSVFLLVAWAILQVLSKENPPTPNRMQPGAGRPGGLPPAPRLPDRAIPAGARPRAGGVSGAEPSDEIIILSAETLRNPAPVTQRPGGTTRPRTTKRARPATPAPAARTEPVRARTLGGPVTQKLSQTIEKAEPLLPLAIGTSPLLVAAAESAKPTATAAKSPLPFNLRDALESESRIREAFVLSEVLQPPVALRRRPR